MAEKNGIAGAGNWIIDHVKIIDMLPPEEHLAVIQSETKGTGGAPYNVLAGLRALDPNIPLQAIGVVGDDGGGQHILEHLRSLRIDSSLMRRTQEKPTSYTDVMTVASTGKRTFFHQRGANALLCEKDFQWDKISARIFHLGYLMLLDSLDSPDPDNPNRTSGAKVLELAHRNGLVTSLDIVTDLSANLQKMVIPALKHVDWFIANELEAGALAGIPVRDANGTLLKESLPKITAKLLEMGVNKLVVIHCPEGGYWREADGADLYQASLKVPRELIKGTAGAGDAFCGGILYGLHEAWTAKECMELAVAHAAMNLSHPTCTAGLKSVADTKALVQSFGFRDF